MRRVITPNTNQKRKETYAEGFSFVTPVTGLNRPNTGKEDDDDDEVEIVSSRYFDPHAFICSFQIVPTSHATKRFGNLNKQSAPTFSIRS
jgi:hypothetical protein